jgi:hypothetical protein
VEVEVVVAVVRVAAEKRSDEKDRINRKNIQTKI